MTLKGATWVASLLGNRQIIIGLLMGINIGKSNHLTIEYYGNKRINN
jgi:hypothetical protein